MDYGLISLWLRDHRRNGIKKTTVQRLRRLVVKFGKETEYPICKFILRIFYKELSAALDENEERIPGKISDERIDEVIYILEKLIHDYYFLRRFES